MYCSTNAKLALVHFEFCPEGSMLQKDGDIDEDLSHKIKVGWLK
jgi:hypothetical protein